MRVLVYPHDLGLGGSQLNAIEIAAGVRDLGHEVAVFGRPGALNARIDELGLEFIEAPHPGKRPSPSVVRALTGLIDDRGFDVLHGYEWPPSLETVLATRLRPSATAVSTVMSMSVPPFVPRSMPLLVGTEEIADAERRHGRSRVEVLEPPVDLAFNRPDLPLDADGFRRDHGIDPNRLTVVAVARFAHELKLEGTLAAIDAVGLLAEETPVQLVLVGDGPARGEVERRVHSINQRVGDGTVVLTGELADPRDAYSIADIALGMGGSALRALAFEKPLIVQGERGFWKLLTPETRDEFLWGGWYGVGADGSDGAQRLLGILRSIGFDPVRRAELALFGRQLVETRFSLERASGIQLDSYRAATRGGTDRGSRWRGDGAAFMRYSTYYIRKRMRRALGTERSDDFNARPVRALAVADRAGSS